MRTIVVPDVHENVAAVERCLAAQPFDRAVFLGDWFDRWPTQPGDALQTARWLARNQSRPDFIFLWGNHDLPYWFPHPGLQCSGYQHDVLALLRREGVEMLPHFRLFHDEQGYRCSHAGFTPEYAVMPGAELQRHCDAAVAGLSTDLRRLHPLLAVGYSRGGDRPRGGCTWQDWSEFEDVAGHPQVVGHSNARVVRWRGGSVCIDTMMRHYAVIEDGDLTVKETPDA